MHYSIIGLIPRKEAEGGMPLAAYGFSIRLYPEWLDLVANYKMTEEKIDHWCRKTMGPLILKACGFNYGSIRVRWGEWGPEYIEVPGNACGLGLWDSIDSPKNGRSLLPHNIDHMNQAYCLLCVFTWFADAMQLEWECDNEGR